MEIRFVSSLTADDENLFAPALLQAVGALLDQLPIAYTIRIETAGSQILQHSHPGRGFDAVATELGSVVESLRARGAGSSGGGTPQV